MYFKCLLDGYFLDEIAAAVVVVVVVVAAK